MEGHWADLTTRGFLVLRDFVPADVLQALIDDAHAPDTVLPAEIDPTMESRAMAAGASTPVSSHVFQRLRDLVEATFDDINAATGFSIDTSYPMSRWFRNGVLRLHSDGPPYYQWQDFSEYLNFWIPVEKPHHDRSGLTFLPFDKLQEVEPAAAEAIRGRGCALLVPRDVVLGGRDRVQSYILDPQRPPIADGERLAIVIERDGYLTPVPVDVDLESLVATPDLRPGDAVVSRGDVLHRSQDQEPGRLAISVRALNGKRTVSKEWLKQLSLPSRIFISSPNQPMEAFIAAFETTGRDTMSAREILDFVMAAFSGEGAEAEAVERVRPEIPRILELPPPPGA